MSANQLLIQVIRATVKRYPRTLLLLSNKARWIGAAALADDTHAYKDYAGFLSRVKGLIKGVYDGNIGGDFIDSMASLIQRQIFLAVNNAWKDEGEGTDGVPLPDYLTEYADQLVLDQYDYVDQLYKDTVDARVDKTGLDALNVRAEMWARRYDEAYNEAVRQITIQSGGKLKWVYGDAEHCGTCAALNGIVAFATQWELVGVKPQSAPNDNLECGGWQCKCSLVPTDERRTRNAVSKIRAAVGK